MLLDEWIRRRIPLFAMQLNNHRIRLMNEITFTQRNMSRKGRLRHDFIIATPNVTHRRDVFKAFIFKSQL